MKLITLFKQLTRLTTPAGCESFVWGFIPEITHIDQWDNVWVIIPTKSGLPSNTLFSCHCDTMANNSKPQLTLAYQKGNLIFSGVDSPLGADDKAGCTLMIKMIEQRIPGFYVFHAGEETGLNGSRALAKLFKNVLDEKDEKSFIYRHIKYLNKVVAFDRPYTTHIVTHQVGTRTASDGFAGELAERLGLGHKPDPTGRITDSKPYSEFIPECTNISVGYENHHTSSEQQDIAYLQRLYEACCRINWETLPILRTFDAPKPERVSKRDIQLAQADEDYNEWLKKHAVPVYVGARVYRKGSGSLGTVQSMMQNGSYCYVRYDKSDVNVIEEQKNLVVLAGTQSITGTGSGAIGPPRMDIESKDSTKDISKDSTKSTAQGEPSSVSGVLMSTGLVRPIQSKIISPPFTPQCCGGQESPVGMCPQCHTPVGDLELNSLGRCLICKTSLDPLHIVPMSEMFT